MKRFFALGLLVLLATFASATFSGTTNTVQYTSPTISDIYTTSEMKTYWSSLTAAEGDCEMTTDFLVGIVPGGCSPEVVTSELLEEQNVPVFCQLYAIKVNPFIDVYSIDSISFKGDYPEGVSGISFHPAQAAINSETSLEGEPVASNIGYVVIVLEQNKVEDDMEEWIAGNLTARIKYDSESAYGVGKAQYYLEAGEPDVTENSFWNGKGYLRLKGVGANEATVEVMSDTETVYRTVKLEKGEISDTIYLPGYYCRVGLKLKLNSFVELESSALLSVDGDSVWVRKGSKILNNKCTVKSINIHDDSADSVVISCPSQTISLSLSERKDAELADAEISSEGFNTAFGLAGETVNSFLDSYRSEEKGNGEYYAEEALYEQLLLAGDAKQFKTQMELMELFVDTYPLSKSIDYIQEKIRLLGDYDYSEASESVYVSSDYHTIQVLQFNEVEEDAKKVTVKFGGKDYTLSEGDKITISGDTEYVQVSTIKAGNVTFKYYNSASDASVRSATDKVSEGNYGSLAGMDIYVTNIDVTEVAYVSLTPAVDNTYSESNFTFGIGVEKRAISLSPERTEEMIENLNESIEEWIDINEKLGTLITGWKGACYATSAVLVMKNLIYGLDGETLARQKVMTEYKEICSTDSEYKSMTSSECYDVLSKQIDADVSSMTKAIKAVNSQMDTAMSGTTEKEGLFGKKVSDTESYIENLQATVGTTWSTTIDGQTIKATDLTTTSQIKSVLLYENLKASGASDTTLAAAKSEMDSELKGVVAAIKSSATSSAATTQLEASGISGAKIQSYTDEKITSFTWDGQTADATIAQRASGISAGNNIQWFVYNGRAYLLKLSKSAAGTMAIDKAYVLGDDNSLIAADVDFKNKIIFTTSDSTKTCSYAWTTGAKVSYYESGVSAGKPAIVPFDLTNGWYAFVPNSGGTYLEDVPEGYTESGDVSYFMICNIGPDRVMSSASGEDICQSFHANTVSAETTFGGCSMKSSEVSSLYEKAVQAIKQAESQYGQDTVKILGQSIEAGASASAITGYECEDFMSPDDCKIMFNVCDPVICPTSRCNLGGQLTVSNVVQSGIFGSILLCLPNFPDVFVPVCLTGVHAGIESYVSILESERDCLQESLDSGEHVGICDEITSIYQCEFFWNEVSTFADLLIPSLFQSIFGGSQGVSGGGEYLFVNQAIENAQASVNYITSFYAADALSAFSLKSVVNVGGEFCSMFVGGTVPSSADLLEEVLEPESPTQFTAHFSSTTYSEATVPATAQYKVYYHIYAGEDEGVQYRVYLSDPPETSYYRSNPTVSVDSGYLAAGETADETVDFTAPEGYKQLCVSINGEEECGFTSVSTSLAVDYVSSKYVEDQADETDITTEKECISGSASLWSLASLNLQSGVEDTINTDITLDGIVRVCATANPGNSVGSSSRWKDVGYCGDENLRCYLDIQSVEDALEVVADVEGTTIADLEADAGLLESGSMTTDEVDSILSDIDSGIEELTSVQLRNYDKTATTTTEILDLTVKDYLENLDKIIGFDDELGSGTNADKAKAYLLEVMIYQAIAVDYLNDAVVTVVDQGARETETDDSEVVNEAVVADVSSKGDCVVYSVSSDGSVASVSCYGAVWYALADGDWSEISKANVAQFSSSTKVKTVLLGMAEAGCDFESDSMAESGNVDCSLLS